MSSHSNNPQAHHDEHLHPEPTSFIGKYVFSFDHKVIAKQFLFFGLFWAFIGAFLSVMIRWCLAFPGVPLPVVGNLLFPSSGGIIPPDVYTMLFTMHGTIMIFFAITPILIGCFGNFCIPLMIGARDMIFPWLNMLSFWNPSRAAKHISSRIVPNSGASFGFSFHLEYSLLPRRPAKSS
jgi:cytochrome c oxidase subunit 1